MGESFSVHPMAVTTDAAVAMQKCVIVFIGQCFLVYRNLLVLIRFYKFCVRILMFY